MKRLLLLTGLSIISSCEMDASLVRQPLEVEQGGAAGQGGNGDVGGAAADGDAAGGTSSTDPYGETRYDWCLPPVYDPMLAPTYPVCANSPSTTLNPFRWTATILVDRSWSMRDPLPGSDTSKWIGVRNALTAMEQEPVGFLDQWSLMAFAADDTTAVGTNCVATQYAATAPVTQTGSHINTFALQAAFDTWKPSALMRPTAAALQAAIADAQQNAALLRGFSTPIVILITDGFPYGCSAGTELAQLTQIVSAINSPPALDYTKVFVIQLGDNFDLTLVAQAGQTERPLVISGGKIDRQLIRILRRILYPGPTDCENWRWLSRSDANGARNLDFDIRIASAYTNTLLAPPHLASAGDCSESPAGGFFITDNGDNQPYMVGLCPCTCAAMGTNSDVTLTMYCGK
jgi:hypothetical protein